MLYRQTIVWAPGVVEMWFWHPPAVVELRLRMEIRGGRRPYRLMLESERDGVIYDSRPPSPWPQLFQGLVSESLRENRLEPPKASESPPDGW